MARQPRKFEKFHRSQAAQVYGNNTFRAIQRTLLESRRGVIVFLSNGTAV